MLLTDLHPRWYSAHGADGDRHGLTFECPHCPPGEGRQRLGVAFAHSPYHVEEDGVLGLGKIWSIEGLEDFATLTLSPSIDASASGHWHGFITNGEVR